MSVITVADLLVFAPDVDPVKAQAMIDDAVAQASVVAPCVLDEMGLSAAQKSQFRAVLRGALLRRLESGAGAVVTKSTTDTAAEYSHSESETVDSSRMGRGMFWGSELATLARICRARRRAATTDTTPTSGWTPFE